MYIYYQIKDLTIACGKERMLSIFKSPKSNLKQRKGVSGFFVMDHSYTSCKSKYNIRVRDLCTISTAIGLKGLIKRFFSEGSENSEELSIKESLDCLKEQMNVAGTAYFYLPNK